MKDKKKTNVSLDRHTRKLVNFKKSDTDAIAPISDLDLAFVNRVLYSSDTK
jgi:hypothetical protein